MIYIFLIILFVQKYQRSITILYSISQAHKIDHNYTRHNTSLHIPVNKKIPVIFAADVKLKSRSNYCVCVLIVEGMIRPLAGVFLLCHKYSWPFANYGFIKIERPCFGFFCELVKRLVVGRAAPSACCSVGISSYFAICSIAVRVQRTNQPS